MLVGGVWKGIYSSIEARLETLEDKYVRTTRFATISSGTSGTVTLPASSTIVLDDFGGTTDAVISAMASGKPTLTGAFTSGGVLIATTFDSSGNYTLTGTPSSYPVAIIYRVQQQLKNFDSTASDIIGDSDVDDQPWIRTGDDIYYTSNGATGKVGINTTAPNDDLSFGGDTARGINLTRNSSTAGSALSIQAGNAALGGTDLNGGSLTLKSGVATGTGSGSIVFQTSTPQTSTGTSDNALSTKLTILGNGNVGIGSGSPAAILTIGGSKTATTAIGSAVGAITEISNANFTDAITTGTVGNLNTSRIGATTYLPSSSVTVTNAAGFRVHSPIASTNATFTNVSNIYIPTNSVQTGSGVVTNSYALNLAAQTGATNNYAATISGNVGLGGVTDPLAPVSIAAQSDVVNAGEQLELRSQRTAIAVSELIGGISFRSNDSSLTAPGTITGLFSMIATAGHTTTVLDTAFVWYTTSTLTMAERMRLDKDGQLGIGVTPAAKIHQDSGTGTASYHKFTANATTGQASTDGFDVGIDASANAELRQREALDLILYTNNAEVARFKSAGNFQVPTTVTGGGTTGNQTINKISGTVNFAAAATAITVTNSLVTANSIVMAVVRTNDTTAVIKNVVPAAGSFVINLNAAATAETSVGFFVIN